MSPDEINTAYNERAGEGAQATFEMQRAAAEAASTNKDIQTKAKKKVEESGAVRARIPPRSGMPYRGYRKRDPQWTDAVLRNVRFIAGGGLLRADDKDGNSVQLFTSKVLPVPATSKTLMSFAAISQVSRIQQNTSGHAPR